MQRVGIDVGGTFTDLFAWDPESRSARTAKVLTTKHDLTEGVLNALDVAEIDLGEVGDLVHGSTTATNALIERSFPEPALITTQGFRDTLEIGRQHRPKLYDPYQTKPAPLVRRRFRFTVPEKMRANGEVRRALDQEAARKVAERIKNAGISNVAIAFINSYANPAHEQQMGEILLESAPDAMVALSSDTPKFRELGRFSTCVVRAALLPVMGDYLERLEEELRRREFSGNFYVIKSSGGVIQASVARAHPEELIESGPAGGVSAATFLGKVTGANDLLATDMGGTSFDVCLIENGRGLTRDDYEIEWDMPIVSPMLDIRSIGSGGGSVAWIDEGGSLRVGPRSAGSNPGPACYGLGGSEPTVTDANLILGRLDPQLGGKIDLDVTAARTAVGSLAEALDMTTEECADGIVRICTENMAAAIKIVSSDRGRDPRDHTLVSFGGAGAMHAWAIAPAAGIGQVLIPRFAGVASAFGATTMDVRHDVERTLYMPCENADLKLLNSAYRKLEQDALERLQQEGFDREDVVLERTSGMRYVGQSYEVMTPVPSGDIAAAAVARCVDDFHAEHRREHGVASETFAVAFVTLRVTATGPVEAPSIADDVTESNGRPVPKSTREVFFDGEFYATPVLDGDSLRAGSELSGPVVIEYADGLVIVPPTAAADVDRAGNVTLTLSV